MWKKKDKVNSKKDVKYYSNGLCKKHIDAIAFAQEVRMICGDNILCILVATKCDLRDGGGDEYEYDCWTQFEMKQLPSYGNCVKYIECSSLKDINVRQVVESACQIVVENDKLKRNGKKRNGKNNCLLM